ncbi:iron-sulfur cluster repair di-iron protein [Halomicrobium mukohataei]|uniref:Iron-sulfur cluster repair di-iron protein n=1 Tax=Halomicrobium mukohataei TaxID=57705 RepID=A0A847UHF0_9EURY|nr:iron-sulfur cluster repair di-iron protein [Halomicrobium mukohataei]NLV11677.1 iron-sulfur cluster repair di-iron protein [Halomicrobium mukohataei]
MTDAIDPTRSLGALVRDNLAYAAVFESVGLDYCCGGDTTLEAACEAEGIDLDDLRERLAGVEEAPDGDDWETHAELIADIVSTHHQYLREELPSLEGLVRKVARVHDENHPELRELRSEYLALAEEMKRHIDEEETDLFPIVETLDRGESLTDAQRATLGNEIAELEADHAETANRLERLAALTDGYAVPDDACASYEAMLERLERLETGTHRHVHKENNVLFAEVERQLPASA